MQASSPLLTLGPREALDLYHGTKMQQPQETPAAPAEWCKAQPPQVVPAVVILTTLHSDPPAILHFTATAGFHCLLALAAAEACLTQALHESVAGYIRPSLPVFLRILCVTLRRKPHMARRCLTKGHAMYIWSAMRERGL